MSAGPYPTKVMHEDLKTRVGALELATSYLSTYGLSDGVTAGHSISGAQTTAQALGLVMGTSPSGQQVTVAGFELPVILPEGQISGISVMLGEETLSSVGPQTVSHTEMFTSILIRPVTLPPGANLVVQFAEPLDVRYAPGVMGAPDNGYHTGYIDAQGAVVAAPMAAALYTLTRQVFGSLAPDAMNVVRAATNLARGDFEVLAAPGSAPRLRFRDYDGALYTLPMTPEP